MNTLRFTHTKLIVFLLLLGSAIAGKAQYYNSLPDRMLYYEVYNSGTGKTHKESSSILQMITRNDSVFIIQSDVFPPISDQIKDSVLLLRMVHAKDNTILFLKDEESEKSNILRMISSVTKQEINGSDIVTKGSIGISLNDHIRKGEKLQTNKFTLKAGPITITTTLNGEYKGFETVRTSAGEFNCIKVDYKMKTKFMLFSETVHITEWYAKDIGLVKREEYNEKEKSKIVKTLAELNLSCKPLIKVTGSH